ncbi:cryptochrome/photolyase family protein [Sulfitobacter sp. SK012]|uniref:cryptochrome/photolyase family protein n=1 Tax=Sulfitobacter sp. SK012 TaxID=1389005 RepID=UPI000E0B2B82|nr:cryptochrome/photolyase family protein [Sulfitobacter sp. SK012]AXI48127.1 cryptochrome/photolyase family protein [Sulfitobacter sp. SK012]
MVNRLILVLGDQLTPSLSALREADCKTDTVVMAEVASEAEYVRHHPKKIALIFAAMRKFAGQLKQDGWNVAYTRLDDPDNAGSIPGELLRRAAEFKAQTVLVTEPGEWRLIEALRDTPLDMHLLPDDRFLASHAEFEGWARDRKQLRMEYFYRDMRRKTGLLMEGDKPQGGKWNFDHDNRKPAKADLFAQGPLRFEPDPVVSEVLDLVEVQFGENFGDLRPFWFATTREQALAALNHFVTHSLPRFGDYQDAMLTEDPFLYHAVISPYLNIGLLTPLEVCEAAEAAFMRGDVPINAAEGFIRQIIGWREYMRGIYFLEGPSYVSRNALEHTRDLPGFFWGAKTKMACVTAAIDQTKKHAYAHHIQRLMVTGNFALLAGIDPHQVHEWYLEVYADAFEWVEAPNVVGMSQFADGGVIASKPYVSSGAYINRMSDHCKTCAYKVSQKTGEGACPFNLLYWDFLLRHRDRFANNARMGNMYRTWDRMKDDHKVQVLDDAKVLLARLDAGQAV